MKCLYCGEEFTTLSVNQKYCSNKCGDKYRRKYGSPKSPSLTFTCACCGRTVVTEEGTKDMRTRFCCAECEKKYWRHRERYEHYGMSDNTNFHSIGEYASYERRTNDEF